MAEMRAAQQTGRNLSASPQRSLSAQSQANTLGARIKLARKRLGLSQQELAGQDYVASYISAIERDKIHPSLKALELIAQRLDEPVEYFLYGGYGSGAFQDASNPSGEGSHLSPETSFSLAVRDKLLEAQLLLENGTYVGPQEGPPLLAQARALLESLPRHQLTEYDRVQVALLFIRGSFVTSESQEIPTQVEEALALARRTQQPDIEVELNCLLGKFYASQRQPEKALVAHEAARALLNAYQNQLVPELQLEVLAGLATAFLAAGQQGQAVEVFEEALRLEEHYNKPQVRAQLYSELAALYRGKGDLYRSRRFSKLAEMIYEQLNLHRHLLRLSAEVGSALTESGKIEEAEKILLKATNVSQRNLGLLGSELALAYNSLVALRIQQNDLPEARRISQLGIEEAHKAGDPLAEGQALTLAADIENRQDRPEEARQLYEQAIGLLEKSATPYALGDVYKAYGEALSRWGDFETAVIYLKKAYDSKK
jgi:transcriptional regulator with XRE-family HTH domain/Flp pilus assembly protein TadD